VAVTYIYGNAAYVAVNTGTEPRPPLVDNSETVAYNTRFFITTGGGQ
jgi:hypothetical protein